ncbi:carbamoyl transferase [Cordyceps fumosorosea ARSEF 2679]|uniref:Carbamoyl transferase n=1 Tax=Cordyceps fumosorosea (strain ARSEF 2679) TaxID=1081104 RepID=A0A167V7P5_CORFA|nr:carbamoyl transferase [Cordyceps fumosorosea ARSEF 2679]OAA62316.1 carbamoyl transferase [Cordyceps fumosorosea ARSEF 2679]
MRILGINSVYHESAAALIVDGQVVAAAEEERFSRVKHGKPARVDNADELPLESIRYCLESAAIKPEDLDAIAYSFDPDLRAHDFILNDKTEAGDWGTPEGEKTFLSRLRSVPDALATHFGPAAGKRLKFIPHHLSHAASSFYPSGYEDAAILVADGIGEAACTVLARGDKESITILREIPFPHSIGFVWEKMSKYLGFTEYDACKAMGLAAYGDASKFKGVFSELMRVDDACAYHVNQATANFRLPDFDRLESLFGPARKRDAPLESHHYDAAAALQVATNDVLLALARELHQAVGSKNLCLAGGVALNCVSNMVIKEAGLFSNVFIPSAPHDAGTAMGAALELNHRMGGRSDQASTTPYLGPEFDEAAIVAAYDAAGLTPQVSSAPAVDAAQMVAAGKIVAWFQGRMEFGPRALGNRSLLADPRSLATRELLNVKVKHREMFRPFAPSVLAEAAGDWFELGAPSPSHNFMLFACLATAERRDEIPAVLHEDGTARVQLVHQKQNPAFHQLISEFATLTGVPLVLNTSFNDSEPIVCTPADAIATFQKTRIDALFISNRFVTREG